MTTAFHRIGIVPAAIPALVALGRLNSADADAHRDAALVALIGCGGAYLLVFAIGRFVARFSAHNDQSSN